MNTGPFTVQELLRATAHHEAGHAVLTLLSKHFQLADPAIKLDPEPGRTAQTGTRPRSQDFEPTKEAAIEHILIALGGRAGELAFEEITEAEGRKIFLHADSAAFDLSYAKQGLEFWKAEHLRSELEEEARASIEANREAWEEIAQLAIRSFRIRSSLSKAEVEALPAVQKLGSRNLTL